VFVDFARLFGGGVAAGKEEVLIDDWPEIDQAATSTNKPTVISSIHQCAPEKASLRIMGTK
jgi:hypothetical protein